MEELPHLLISKLRELATIFRSFDVIHWVEWLKEDVKLIEDGDLEGIHHLLSEYGGMGSITDVFITPKAGYKIAEDDISQVNNQISSMLSEIYSNAIDIKRDQSML